MSYNQTKKKIMEIEERKRGEFVPRIIKPIEDRKREILDAARELFFEKGYINTSIGEIAKKIGIAQGLFYHYFNSKDEVFCMVMEEFTDEIIGRLKHVIALPNVSLHEKIDQIFKVLLDIDDRRDPSLSDELHFTVQTELHSRLTMRIAEEMKDSVKTMLEENGIANSHAAAYLITFGAIGITNDVMDMYDAKERESYVQAFLAQIRDLLGY
ncbi:MAG: TetR/AcrR family transcriptional regulator [Methanobacterium sp.]